MSTTNNELADSTHRNAAARKPDEGALQRLSERSSYYTMWILTDQGRWRAVQKSLLVAPVLWFFLEPHRPRTGTARPEILWRLGTWVHQATRLPDATGTGVHYAVALGVIVSICALAASICYEIHRVRLRYSGPHQSVVSSAAVSFIAFTWMLALQFSGWLGGQGWRFDAIEFISAPIYVATFFGIASIPRALTSYFVGSIAVLPAIVPDVRSTLSSNTLVVGILACSMTNFVPRFILSWPKYFRDGRTYPLADVPQSCAAFLKTGVTALVTFALCMAIFSVVPGSPRYPIVASLGIAGIAGAIANSFLPERQRREQHPPEGSAEWPEWSRRFYAYRDMAQGLRTFRHILWPLIPAIVLETYGLAGLATLSVAVGTILAHLLENPASDECVLGTPFQGR